MLTHGSLFSGVGGCDLGFEAAGFSTGFQVEWDKHCQQVLAYRWPDVPRWSDVSDVSGFELPPVDVLSYGFPCQDLSVAGKRAGLDGDRSGLFFEAVRIIREMREATDGLYPRFAVAENVVGLLNADGGDAMARVLDTLAEAGSVGIEWCVLDAQWFGVPQRRRRVFVTACFDSATFERCPNPLFPIAESSARNPAESSKARETVTGTLACSFDSQSQIDVNSTEPCIPTIFPTLNTHDGTKWGSNQWVDEGKALVIPMQDGTKFQSQNGIGVGLPGSPMFTLTSIDQHAIAFSHTQGLDPQASSDAFPTLRSGGAGHAVSTSELDVRRLTPTECERLMGWPDDHTRYRADGTEASDSQRYKQCGNGIVAPVAAWIAKHLRDALQDDQ